MHKKIILSLIVICCSAAAFSNDILPYPIHQKELPNGLKVVSIPFDSPGLASFYIVVRVGSRDETEPGKTGFAHFFEHMMFRGTERYSKEQYSEKLKSTGASANANTSLDRTVYHMTGSASSLETMFELEADRFQHLKYSVQDFKTEAGAVKGEYTKNNSSPYSRLYEATNNIAFDKHTYKHTTMGFFNDNVDMPNQYEFSLEFFNRYYRPEYCTIIVVGDVDHERVFNLAEKFFGDWQRGNYVSTIPVEPVQTETRTVNIKVEQFPPYIDLKFKGPSFSVDNNDYHALTILGQLLFSEKSDLYKKMVINEQKARNLSGGIYPSRDPYLFSVSASIASKTDLEYVYKQMMDAVELMKTKKIDENSLKQAKERIRYSFALSMDSPDAIANAVASYVWVTGNAENINKSYKLFETVTAADIQRVAKKYLVKSGLTIATISPDDKSVLK